MLVVPANKQVSYSTDRITLLPFLLFLAISFVANSPLLGSYEYYLDDYLQFPRSLGDWLATRGTWRIAGTLLPGWLVSTGLYGFSAIFLHAIGAFFFFIVARYCLGSMQLAFFLSVVMIAFPWGYQALIWASAASFAFASCVIWAVLCLLLYTPTNNVQAALLAAVLSGASFLSLLFNEAGFFVLCIAGVVVWMRSLPLKFSAKAIISIAPLAGALLWSALYELSKPDHPIKAVTHVNIRSAFSALAYQYSNLEVFDVLMNGPLRRHALSTIDPIAMTTTLAALAAVPLLVRALYSMYTASSPSTKTHIIDRGGFLIWMALLCFGAASIYALAGGYSLDARKRYLIVPLLLMAAAAAFCVTWPAHRGRFGPRFATAVTTLVCILGCFTSVLMMSLWKYEMARINSLADAIAANGLSGGLQVDWKPDLKKTWPRSERSWGIDNEVALNVALQARSHAEISIERHSRHVVSWDPLQRRWFFHIDRANAAGTSRSNAVP